MRYRFYGSFYDVCTFNSELVVIRSIGNNGASSFTAKILKTTMT